MKSLSRIMKTAVPPSRISAFTLIELLVVIAIIVVLMGLLAGVIPKMKDAARRAEAKNMCQQICSAVNSYVVDNGRLPEVTADGGATDEKQVKDVIVGETAANAVAPNNALFNTLRNIPIGLNADYAMNPKKTVYFEARAGTPVAGGTARSGFYDRAATGGVAPADLAGSLYDPWGKQYCVILDRNGDGRIDLTGVYLDFTGVAPGTGLAPRAAVGAFSLGTDGEVGVKGDHVYRQGPADVADDQISW